MTAQLVAALAALCIYDAWLRRGPTFALLVFGYMLVACVVADVGRALVRRFGKRVRPPRPSQS